jgi:hypothetical protein
MARLNNARSRISSRLRPPQLAVSFECRLLAVATNPQYLSLWRDLLIDELSESGSVAQTHIVIAKLLKHTEFSATQIEQLVQIARSNRQVCLDHRRFGRSCLLRVLVEAQTQAIGRSGVLDLASLHPMGPASRRHAPHRSSRSPAWLWGG